MDATRICLTQLGLSDKQQAAYLALLELGSAAPADIAQRAGLKRPTVYDLLGELEARGLIVGADDGRRRRYHAKPPRALIDLLRLQERQLKAALPELSNLFNRSATRPTVSFREGREGVFELYERLLDCRDREYRYIGIGDSILKALGDTFLADYVKRRVKAGIWSHALRIRSREVEHQALSGGRENLRRLRYLSRPPLEDIASLHLFDNTVAICSSDAESYLLLIESPELVRLMRYMWDMLWNVAEDA